MQHPLSAFSGCRISSCERARVRALIFEHVRPLTRIANAAKTSGGFNRRDIGLGVAQIFSAAC